jgi:hypothetical protein
MSVVPDTPTRELASLDAALAEEANHRRVIDHAERQAHEAVHALEREHVQAMRHNDAARMKSTERKLADARQAASRDRRLETRAADARIRDRQADVATFIKTHGDQLLADAQADGQRIAAKIDELLAELSDTISALPAVEARLARIVHIVAPGHERAIAPPSIDDVRELLRQRRGTTTTGPAFVPPPPAGIVAEAEDRDDAFDDSRGGSIQRALERQAAAS